MIVTKMAFSTDVVIGLEVHTQLDTKTKLFCSCPTQGDENPNSRVCPICLGHPGSKPVVNKKASEYAVKLALALECTLAPQLVFSRKSYFYPDLAKNYQITQYELPLGEEGRLALDSGKAVGITRVHLEEDPAALVHPGSIGSSAFVLVDYNRSGNPLVEIVSKPDLASPGEARDFMRQVITILQYLEIFNESRCIIKADANVSIKESGYVRIEVKNITGFKEIERSLIYEVARQKQELKAGHEFKQETRAWDSEKGITLPLRTKETEEDYGYIIDPDLTVVNITEEWVKRVKDAMPELAREREQRYIAQHSLSPFDARVLAQEKKLSDLFEKVAKEIDPVLAAKWLRRELTRVMNYSKKSFDDLELDETHLIDLIGMVEKKEITESNAQKIMELLIEKPFNVRQYVKNQNLKVISDLDSLEKLCLEAISEAPQAVEDYKAGNEKSLNFVVGIVMKKTKGQADPKVVQEALKKLLD